MFYVPTAAARTARPTPIMLSSKVSAPRPGRVSTSLLTRRTQQHSGTALERTVVFYNRQGEAQELRLFPDLEDVPLHDDPDVARIRLRSVGWSNARRFGDVWLARWLWHYLAWTTSSPAMCRRQGNSATGRRGGHRGHQPPVPACSEFALAEHWYAATGLEELLGVPTAPSPRIVSTAR